MTYVLLAKTFRLVSVLYIFIKGTISVPRNSERCAENAGADQEREKEFGN
jgi:hypothetical protein